MSGQHPTAGPLLDMSEAQRLSTQVTLWMKGASPEISCDLHHLYNLGREITGHPLETFLMFLQKIASIKSFCDE